MPTLTPPSDPGFTPPPRFPTVASFPSLAFGSWPPFPFPTSGIAINANQSLGQHTVSLKTILISVGATVAAILCLLVILVVYCRRRKRRRLAHDGRIAHPFTKSPSPPPHISQPPDSFEAAQKYIDVLEDRIETMRREEASATTAESPVGPNTLETPAPGEPERDAPPPEYEPILHSDFLRSS